MNTIPIRMTVKNKPKAVIGLSGGVDSAVASALLQQQGFDVVGVTLNVYSKSDVQKAAFEKTAAEAEAVARKLGISHKILDVQEEFEQAVVAYFMDAYRNGQTPNPCAVCNPKIKFRFLMEQMVAEGASGIATGHYADVVKDPITNRFLLKNSSAAGKDQTYVLYGLSQNQLSHLLLPLGNAAGKEEVRQMAREWGIPVAEKPDSQEICFIPNGGYADFIIQKTGYVPKPGKFIDRDGNILGNHRGILYYTVGQRKGLGQSFGKPMFVLSINAGDNTVTLGEAGSEFSEGLIAAEANFLAFESLTTPQRIEVKIRYAAKPSSALILPLDNGRIEVRFDRPQRAVTPGQAVVFYQGDYLIGGARIVNPL